MSVNTATIDLTQEEANNLLVCVEQTVKLGGPNLPHTCQFYLNMLSKLKEPFLKAVEKEPDGTETE